MSKVIDISGISDISNNISDISSIKIKIEIEHNIRCNCCLEKEDIEICPLDNCDYPICIKCKKKIFKEQNKCPKCRRVISKKIIKKTFYEDTDDSFDSWDNYQFDDDDDDDDDDYSNCTQSFCKLIYKIFSNFCCFLKVLSIFIAFFVCTFICLLIGRLVTTVFRLGPLDFFCLSTGVYALSQFLLYSFIGILIITGVLCMCSCFFLSSDERD